MTGSKGREGPEFDLIRGGGSLHRPHLARSGLLVCTGTDPDESVPWQILDSFKQQLAYLQVNLTNISIGSDIAHTHGIAHLGR